MFRRLSGPLNLGLEFFMKASAFNTPVRRANIEGIYVAIGSKMDESGPWEPF